MAKIKRGTGKVGKKEQIRVRSKYVDHSVQFLSWVNALGFEKSLIGRWARVLDRKFRLRRVAVLFLYCFILSSLLFLDLNVPYQAEEGMNTKMDLKSPITFAIVDEVATEQKRLEAEAGVLNLFDFDPEIYERIDSQVYKSFKKYRDLTRTQEWPESESAYDRAVQEFFVHKENFEKEIGTKVSARIFEWLVRKKFRKPIENALSGIVTYWSAQKISEKGSSGIRPDDSKIMIRELNARGGPGEEYSIPVADLRQLSRRRSVDLKEIGPFEELDVTDRANVRRLGKSLLTPNLTYNLKETLERRHAARDAVLPVQISIKKNQVIVAKGSVVQPIHMTILNEIKNLQSDRRTDFMALVSALLLVTLILVFFSYARRFTTNKVRVSNKDLGLMGLVTLVVLLITKVFLFLMDASFMERWGDVLPDHFFLYLAPVAAGPMLVGLVITSGEVVWLFTTFLAFLLATMVDLNFNFLVVSLVGGIAAARGVFSCGKRNDIYMAGVRTGLVNAISISCLLILNKGNGGALAHQMAWIVPGAFLAGLLSSMVAMIIVPLIESFFSYVTDVKLLELSNLSHPLMQAMVIKAPGTYHHCLSVGTMVFAAAREIGANALLAKVMAYYHDIGKMDHPNYFIENQRPGLNPHDQISPYMSKTVLIAHVKDGAELAIKHKLGRPILDGILQHHGTSLISYFYNKAISEQNDQIDQVLESEFRYPGPKPQFREAALVMLADSIEAAARSLDEPTPIRLQNLVKNIIQGKFIDGQLDQCNLTLRDLSVIEQSFKHSILSIYHQRMDYPHMKDGKLIEVPRVGRSKGHTA